MKQVQFFKLSKKNVFSGSKPTPIGFEGIIMWFWLVDIALMCSC